MTSREAKPCTFFSSKAGCRNGRRCSFLHVLKNETTAEGGAHDKNVPPVEKGPPPLNLEGEMLRHGCRILTVDRRTDRGGFAGYFASNQSGKGPAVSSSVAYAALRASLLTADSLHGSVVVGVDLEGTSNLQVGSDGVALMVQVSSASVCVIEYPRGRCSDELAALLSDAHITKAFCGVEGDAQHLGQGVAIGGPVEDLEEMATALLGPSKSKRGLAAILSLATDQKWAKRSIKKEKWWYFTNADQMISNQRNFTCYAAADAWGTWLAHAKLAQKLAVKLAEKLAEGAVAPAPGGEVSGGGVQEDGTSATSNVGTAAAAAAAVSSGTTPLSAASTAAMPGRCLDRRQLDDRGSVAVAGGALPVPPTPPARFVAALNSVSSPCPSDDGFSAAAGGGGGPKRLAKRQDPRGSGGSGGGGGDSVQTPAKKACRFFGSPEGCRFGALCRFTHQPPGKSLYT